MVGVGGLLVMEKVGINDDFMKDVFVGDLGLAPITNLVNREEPIDGLDWIGLDWMGLALTGGLSEEERVFNTCSYFLINKKIGYFH